MNLLILNDEVLTADTLKTGIDWNQIGIRQVFTAYDAGTARKIMQENPVDIILCDIEMPDEDGLSFMRWVRNQGYDTDCLFLTCHANFVYAQEAIRLNCQNYILMPARKEDIAAAVCQTMELREKRQQDRMLEIYGARWLESKKDELRQEQKERDETRKDPSEIVEESLLFIHSHMADPELSVNLVAEHMYLNSIYLNRIFKKVKGKSIGQMIIQERMTLAGKLMEEPESAAQDVAMKVGYQNYPYFSTAFKKFFGCSPQQFKEEKKTAKKEKSGQNKQDQKGQEGRDTDEGSETA